LGFTKSGLTLLNGAQGSEKREKTLKSGDFAYHRDTSSYLKLEKIVAATGAESALPEWECIVYTGTDSKNEKKTTVNASEFRFYITVQLCVQMPERNCIGQPPEISLMKVDITEPLHSSLVNPLAKLQNAELIFIYKGKTLDVKGSPKDLNLPDKAQVMVLGVLTAQIENIVSMRATKFFKRFRDTRNDGWYIGRDRFDAVTFTPRVDVRIFGAGVFEPYPLAVHNFTYGHKYVIQEGGSDIETSQVYEEEVICPPTDEIQDHMIMVTFKAFPTGILVRHGQKFVHASWIHYTDGHNRCNYSESGDRAADVVNPDMGLFEITDSSLSSNSTRVNRGIVPGLIYCLA
jgi:PHR domain